jgi:hypothetical protein
MNTSYFKIIDKNVHKKLKPVFKLSESLFKPIWKSEDLWMLKSQYSHIEKTIMEKTKCLRLI